MVIYKINFDEDKHIYFSINKEKAFIKYKKILEKIRNTIKNKFNSELIYSKKYLTGGKKIDAKGGFQCLYAPVKDRRSTCSKTYQFRRYLDKYTLAYLGS